MTNFYYEGILFVFCMVVFKATECWPVGHVKEYSTDWHPNMKSKYSKLLTQGSYVPSLYKSHHLDSEELKEGLKKGKFAISWSNMNREDIQTGTDNEKDFQFWPENKRDKKSFGDFDGSDYPDNGEYFGDDPPFMYENHVWNRNPGFFGFFNFGHDHDGYHHHNAYHHHTFHQHHAPKQHHDRRHPHPRPPPEGSPPPPPPAGSPTNAPNTNNNPPTVAPTLAPPVQPVITTVPAIDIRFG